MRKILLTIFSAFIFIGPMRSCPIEPENKNKMLLELCSIDNDDWSSNRLNEMIILFKFGKLPFENNLKDNRILASLICDFTTIKD